MEANNLTLNAEKNTLWYSIVQEKNKEIIK